MEDSVKAPPASSGDVIDSTGKVIGKAGPPLGILLRPYDEWARTKQIAAWQVKAAAVGKHWPLGQEMSEADFDAAILDVTTHVSR